MRVIILLLLPILFTLSSCVRLAVKGVKKRTNLEYVVPTASMYADAKFDGLAKFIDSARDTASILMIHGLTRKNENHFDFLVQRLAYKLQLRLVVKKDSIPLSQSLQYTRKGRVLGFGGCKLFKWEFRRRTDDKVVNAYFIYWEPVFKTFKDFIIEYDNTRYRTGLSTLAKDGVFINVLSDLALYLNLQCKVQIHDLFLQSVEKMSGDIVVIAGGFGVQMLFDAMNLELEYRTVLKNQNIIKTTLETFKYISDTVSRGIGKANADSVRQRNPSIQAETYIKYKDSTTRKHTFRKPYDIRKVFLIGNQLPFTSLLSLDPQGSLGVQEMNDNVFDGFHKFLEQKQRVNPKDSIEIISFYDPNDPFGYRLPQSSWKQLIVKNVKLNIAEYWQIDPRKTTDFVLPKLKGENATDFFLNIIDQQDSTQSLMLNLEGPANQSRNDYRIIGAIANGSDYPFVCTTLQPKEANHRDLRPRAKMPLSGLVATISTSIVDNINHRLDIEHSVLPFSLPSQYRDYSPNKRVVSPFGGIDESVKSNRLTQLITVHGVKNQEPDHFDMMTREIAKTLGFYETPQNFRVVCAEAVCPEGTNANYGPGTIKITTFKSITGKELIIYNVYWSSVTHPAKEWLKSASIYDESSIIPKMVKDVLVTDGLSDIELSFQGDHDQIMKLLSRAFSEMEHDFVSAGIGIDCQNTYYMTGSLGTRLLLDYLNTRMGESATKEVQGRAKTWFMLTNQLIITELKNVHLLPDMISYDAFFKEAYGEQGAPVQNILDQENSNFEIVAFNDPNDIMSFIVPDDAMGMRCGERIHNTYINIAQGAQVNMNALIKIAWRADKKLQEYHRKRYRHMLHCFRHCPSKLCDGIVDPTKLPDDHQYWEMEEIMMISKHRFKHWFVVDSHLSQNRSVKLDNLINDLLSADSNHYNPDKLELKLKKKKKWYTSDLYVNEGTVTSEREKYRDIKSIEKKTLKRT
ncbi:MAG TPA: hypothetical protein VF473_10170, partial [Cyclobacteriaceae bacterium]